MSGCQYLQKLPILPLLAAALLLGLAPFTPEPHLLEKLRHLFSGNLHRGIDVFDLFLHATPVLLLLLRLGATIVCRSKNPPQN